MLNGSKNGFDVRKYENLFDMLVALGWKENDSHDSMVKDDLKIEFIEFYRPSNQRSYSCPDFLSKMLDKGWVEKDFLDEYDHSVTNSKLTFTNAFVETILPGKISIDKQFVYIPKSMSTNINEWPWSKHGKLVQWVDYLNIAFPESCINWNHDVTEKNNKFNIQLTKEFWESNKKGKDNGKK